MWLFHRGGGGGGGFGAYSNDRKKLGLLVPFFFLLGSETTSTTLTWAVLYMVREPAVQARVHAEIDSTWGRHQRPSLADKDQMPYTAATLLEVLRIGNIVPQGVPHLAHRYI
jgi:cytochrome P450